MALVYTGFGNRVRALMQSGVGVVAGAFLVLGYAASGCVNTPAPDTLDISGSGGQAGSEQSKGGAGGGAGSAGNKGSGGKAGANGAGGTTTTSSQTSTGGTTATSVVKDGGIPGAGVVPSLDSATEAAATDASGSSRPDSAIADPPKDNLYTPPFDPSKVPNIQPLFDGKTLTGWNCNPNTWKVVDGAIEGTGGGEFCITKDEFASVRMFVSTKAPGEHQGIGFWGPQPPPGKWGNGDVLNLVVMPPNTWTWDYLSNGGIATAAGAISNAQPDVTIMKQWTQAEILLNRTLGRIQMAANGKLVLDIKVANLNRPKPKGPLGLQAHGGNKLVLYKDIWVEIDPKEDKLISLKP